MATARTCAFGLRYRGEAGTLVMAPPMRLVANLLAAGRVGLGEAEQ